MRSRKRSLQNRFTAQEYRVFIGQLLLQAQQLVALNRPQERDQCSVRSYIEKHGHLMRSDSRFAYEKEDLITLRPGRDHSFVDGFVEQMLKTFHCQPLKARDPNTFVPLGWERLTFLQHIFCSKVSRLCFISQTSTSILPKIVTKF